MKDKWEVMQGKTKRGKKNRGQSNAVFPRLVLLPSHFLSCYILSTPPPLSTTFTATYSVRICTTQPKTSASEPVYFTI